LDVVEVVEAGPGALADRLTGSVWTVRLPGSDEADVRRAVTAFLAQDAVEVQRILKNGRRALDARAAVVALDVDVHPRADPDGAGPQGVDAEVHPMGEPMTAPVLILVLRHLTPSVRPDDVLAGLCSVSGLVLAEPAQAVRLAQGMLDEDTATVADPLAPDRTGSPAHSA
jgi:hypothetical protein